MPSLKKAFCPFLIFLLGLGQISRSALPESGSITGKITDSRHNPLANVNITIPGTSRGSASDTNGIFRIDKLRPGKYALLVTHIGFEKQIEKDVTVKANQTTSIDFQLAEIVLNLREIIVTPGNFFVSQNQTTRQQIIEKEKILSVPATLDDICRVVQIMPGVSFSDDYSARFHVRGGKQSENLILMDGMEIFDPYHLKHVGGAVGVMNMDLIQDVSILTGGFPAKYGDRLSSVLAIGNRVGCPEKISGNFGAGGTGARMVLEGPMPGGSWLASFRKSFLKEAAEILNPTDYTFSPAFYDAQAKVSMKLNPENHFIVNYLYSKDDTYLEKWRGDSDLFSDYGNSYYGVVWQCIFKPNVMSELVVSNGKNFWDNHIGKVKSEKLTLTEKVANWNLNLLPHQNHDIELGLTFKHIQYRYELKTESLSQDQQNFDELIESYYGDSYIKTTTNKIGLFIQDKFRLNHYLLANLGGRYDYFEYNRDQQYSPRAGFALTLRKNLILRAAWGHYYQSPNYTELTIRKGSNYNPRAQKATHYVLGIEQLIANHLNLRIEGYVKKMDRMIGYYFEASQSPSKPMICYGNPYKGLCQGIEFFINGKLTTSFSLWLAYAYSKSQIEASFVNWEEMTVLKRTVPRFTDQPHNLSIFGNWKLARHWELNIKWRYLSGVPYTPFFPSWDTMGQPYWRSGKYYESRYPDYHRLDLRVGKVFEWQKLTASCFLEIKNLYNHQNILLYDYDVKNGKHHQKAFHTIPFLPTLEFNIQF